MNVKCLVSWYEVSMQDVLASFSTFLLLLSNLPLIKLQLITGSCPPSNQRYQLFHWLFAGALHISQAPFVIPAQA